MSAAESRWTRLCDLDQVSPGAMHSVAHEGHKLVVVRADADTVAVLDNRCPHEGYPLSQGQLDGGTLTCCWHNWKFNVADGACLMGGEGAKSWPSRVVGGAIEVDVSEPDPATVIPGLLDSFREGLFDHDNGRSVRDGVRLLQLGFGPQKLLLELAVYDARHAEYGSTHVLALAADCGRGQAVDAGAEAMYAIAPVIDLCGEANRRLPARQRGPALACSLDSVSEALRAAVEAEDVSRAQGLLAGAFDAGVSWPTVQGWLLTIAADHFTDFGHQLIYLTKMGTWFHGHDKGHDGCHDGGLEDVDSARELALGLLDSLLFATREDTLPYMGRYSRRLAALEDELPALFAAVNNDAIWDGSALRTGVLDGSAAQALDALEHALRQGVRPQDIARELVVAAAHRLLRFNVALDSDNSCAEGWLWASHRFTFAAAVRQAVEALATPAALRFLFQAVAFVHSGQPMDGAADERSERASRRGAGAGHASAVQDLLDRVLAAMGARHAGQAVDAAEQLLMTEPGAEALQSALRDLCLADPLVRPIVVAHAIKTTWAAFEERTALGDHPDRDVPVLAAVRMLASPIVERRIHELVQRSIAWVAHGEMPRKLTQ